MHSWNHRAIGMDDQRKSTCPKPTFIDFKALLYRRGKLAKNGRYIHTGLFEYIALFYNAAEASTAFLTLPIIRPKLAHRINDLQILTNVLLKIPDIRTEFILYTFFHLMANNSSVFKKWILLVCVLR